MDVSSQLAAFSDRTLQGQSGQCGHFAEGKRACIRFQQEGEVKSFSLGAVKPSLIAASSFALLTGNQNGSVIERGGVLFEPCVGGVNAVKNGKQMPSPGNPDQSSFHRILLSFITILSKFKKRVKNRGIRLDKSC